jgi:hypothetical protein
MCEQTALPVETKNTSKRRKKLWEVGEGHHCSILGTCLRRTDLRRLSRKKIFQMESGDSDYQIHLTLVGFAASRNSKSRAMHKFLDGRYRVAIKRYAAAHDDEVLELWNQDVKKGTVAGAYWAIMTNQLLSSDVRTEVYGQNHMLGFDNIVGNQQKHRLHEETANKIVMLEEVLVSERQTHLKEQMATVSEMENLKKVQKKSVLLAAENKKIVEKNIRLTSELAGISLSGEIGKLKEQLRESSKRNAGLNGEVETLKRKLEDKSELFELANADSEVTMSKNIQLEGNMSVLQQEVASMETAMLGSLDSSRGCSNCDDQKTSRCPGPDLCGKTILYVGGLHKMVSLYRQLVESHGGNFLHHDGGKEASRAILPKMLSTADAVLCPIDCISHDACTCVKKICKQYQKPYVMMRSSGLSSLAKGLTEIVQ